MAQTWRIALVLIARNEAPRIRRLLAAWRPGSTRYQMLALDTGSVDDTAALAQAAGAQVHHGPWPNDFSLARNLALDLTCADWHVVLDADEWVIDGGAAIAALRHTSPDFVGALQFQNQYHDGKLRHANAWMSCVFPGALRYQGRVHQQVVPELPLRCLSIRIGHDGYLPQCVQARRGRTSALLAQELAQRPTDAYAWYQLGKSCDVYNERAAAEAAFERAAALGGARQPWWNDLVVRRLFTLKCLKRHADAMDFADGQKAP